MHKPARAHLKQDPSGLVPVISPFSSPALADTSTESLAGMGTSLHLTGMVQMFSTPLVVLPFATPVPVTSVPPWTTFPLPRLLLPALLNRNLSSRLQYLNNSLTH